MVNRRTESFDKLLEKLGAPTKVATTRAYVKFKRDPSLVNYEMKGRDNGIPHYGARIDGNFRALAYEKEGRRYWYWVGTHTDYDRILKGLSK